MENKTINLHTAYFREARTCYTLEDFNKKLGLKDLDKAKKIVAALKRTGIAKAVKKTEFNLNKLDEQGTDYLITDDISANSDIGYVLNYVGFAFTDDCLIKCYPKYINEKQFNSEVDTKEKIEKHFKTLLKVIRKINAKEEQIHLYNGQEDSHGFNRLAVALYLLDDYYRNGVYSNLQTIIETNGEGEIDWDKTINETFAILKNNKPFYVELQTINTQSNELDYFKLLHECVLTMCSQELEKAGVLELFDMMPVEITSMTLDEFGDTAYIQYRLEKEIQNQFVSKKQTLLKTLYTFITETKSNEINNTVSLFGTNAFNMIWEKACAAVFKNELKTKFKDLKKEGLIEEFPDNPNYDSGSSDSHPKMKPNESLIDLIEKAKWRIKDSVLNTQDTLIPDIISIERASKAFIILDAKYYCFEVDESKKLIYHQPGIQDIVKQFAYHQAYRDFIYNGNFEKVGNAFLVPQKTYENTEKTIDVIGDVTLNIMNNFGFAPLAPIQVVEINPEGLYKSFLAGKEIKTELVSSNVQFHFEKTKTETVHSYYKD